MGEAVKAEGRILKATGGFYYVQAAGRLVECRGRGLLRREGLSPAVGDFVTLLLSPDGTGTVTEIRPRKNELVRPPLANLDQMVVVISVSDPVPNLLVTDSYLSILEHKGIPALIAVSKADLGEEGGARALASLYEKAGYPVIIESCRTGEGIPEITALLAGRLSAFSGNSGVGKSSLLNAIDPRFAIDTGETSKKLGRGRHTTRHVEAFPLQNGGLIADTPGFSSIDLLQMSDLHAQELAGCFREFAPHLGGCRFADCAHIREAGCAVLAALRRGEIAPTRHRSYEQLYKQLKDVREWERKTRGANV